MLKKIILLIVFTILLATGLLFCMYLEHQKSEAFQETEITEAAETAQTEETQEVKETTIAETHSHATTQTFDEEYETSTVMTEPENIHEREPTVTTEPPPKKPVTTNPQEADPKPSETVVPDTQTPEETLTPAPEDEWGVGRA